MSLHTNLMFLLVACRSMEKAQALASQMASGAQVVSLDELNAGKAAAITQESPELQLLQ